MMKTDYSKLTDLELVAIIKRKDKSSQKAFAEIYTRYSQRLYAYCLRMLRNAEDAKDLYQETFIKFYNNISQKNDTGSIISYLIAIAKHIWLNDKRKNKTVLLNDKFENCDENLEDLKTNINIEQRELEQIIPDALMQLKQSFREIIILRLYEGMSYNRITEITGLSGSLLRNRFFRAKEQLRLILEDCFQEKKTKK